MKRIYQNIRFSTAKIAILTLSLSILASSCGEDFLNLPPELDIPEENAFDSPELIEGQVNGLYGAAKHGRLFGGRYQIYNDIRGGEFVNRTSNVVTGYSAYQFTNDPSDTYIEDFWNHGYRTINRVNKFLADFDNHPGVVSPELEAQYRAEAKFIRGLTYYALVQLFAKPYQLDNGASRGLPLRLQPETSTVNNELAPSSVADIYTQIMQDLNDAEAGLPDDYDEGNTAAVAARLRTTRAHKNTAIALKTRIYLAMGRYEDVITEGNKIVSATAPFVSPNGVQHTLQSNVTAVFAAPYTTLESVFSFPMSDTNAPGTQNQLGYYYNVGNIEYYLNQSAPGIYADTDAWPSDDARRDFTGAYSDAWHILTKFSGAAPFADWVPIIRYPEVLLNVAEAEAEVGSQARAIALLQAVRHRSDPDYVFTGLTSSEAIVDAILTERRIEFIGEGFRAPDVQRRLLSFNGEIGPNDDRYVFPIPTSELLTNPGMIP